MLFQEFFYTERLVFRPFNNHDLSDLAAIVADPNVMKFVGDGIPLDTSATELWIKNSRKNVKTFGYGTGAVIDRSSGQLLGWAGFARPEGEAEELIYGFGQAYWKRGYGTEILAALISYAWNELGMTELRATIFGQNYVSKKLLENSGFKCASNTSVGSTNFILNRP